MKKILIIKIGAIGDVVMCLPLIPEIKKTHPESEITWLCGNQVRPLLERIEGIDKLISVDENRLMKGSFISRISEISKRKPKDLESRKIPELTYQFQAGTILSSTFKPSAV